MKIEPDKSLLLIIDVQEKLIDHIYGRNIIVENIKILVKTFSVLNFPIILSEQYPNGLGKTIDDILINKPNSDNFFSFEKITFSCFPNDSFKKLLSKLKKK
ncbi:MAG: hydrolase, partial [Rickettsiales bacterium]|nr:hydrolase [Rickettsiales bacterium]